MVDKERILLSLISLDFQMSLSSLNCRFMCQNKDYTYNQQTHVCAIHHIIKGTLCSSRIFKSEKSGKAKKSDNCDKNEIL